MRTVTATGEMRCLFFKFFLLLIKLFGWGEATRGPPLFRWNRQICIEDRDAKNSCLCQINKYRNEDWDSRCPTFDHWQLQKRPPKLAVHMELAEGKKGFFVAKNIEKKRKIRDSIWLGYIGASFPPFLGFQNRQMCIGGRDLKFSCLCHCLLYTSPSPRD